MQTTYAPRLNTSTQRGKAAELRALAWLIEAGYECALPASDDTRIDIVYRRIGMDGNHGPWLSAQVKRCYQKYGHRTVNLVRSNGQRYDETDADFLFAVDEDGLWAIPFANVCHQTRLRITRRHECYRKVMR